MLEKDTYTSSDLPTFTSKMENGSNINLPSMNSYLMKALDQGSQATSNHDVMARRLKNRERQRRYRARKRHEADMKKARIVNQLTPLQVEMQVSSISHEFVTRIHCQRDWKKDARRAHILTEQKIMSIVPDPTLESGSQAPYLPSGAREDLPSNSGFHSSGSPVVNSSETPRTSLSRRHWKAEARNKNS